MYLKPYTAHIKGSDLTYYHVNIKYYESIKIDGVRQYFSLKKAFIIMLGIKSKLHISVYSLFPFF